MDNDIILENVSNMLINIGYYEKVIVNNIDQIHRDIIRTMFKNLDNDDIYFLFAVSYIVIDKIKNLFYENIEEELYKNNNRDFKALLLLLLPYYDEEEIKYDQITRLQDLILNVSNLNPNMFNDESMDKFKKQYIPQSNIVIDLLNQDYEINGHIYYYIYNNLLSLLETLDIISGKLYVNWINIFPIIDYKNSNIYKKTMKEIQNFDIDKYKGTLYIGEFYNVLRNVYYEDIKKIKWLLFMKNNKYYIEIINEQIDLILKYNSYEELNTNEIIIFKKIKEIDLNVLKNIIIYLVNNYTYRRTLDYNLNKPFFINIDYDAIDNDFNKNDLIKIDEITQDMVNNFMEKTDIIHIWNYLKETIITFKNTIYSKKIISKNKVMLNTYNIGDISLKNIYNIAKSISHDQNWVLLPIKYNALNREQQILFFNRLNNKIDFTNWVKLYKNYLLTNEFIQGISYTSYINNIKNKWDNIKYDLIWEYLSVNGLLSEFKINNTSSLSIKEYNNCNYFLTNDTYENLNKIKLVNYEDNYLNYLTKKQKWYTFYAMNWIAQIGFFHKYLNHNVLFITGATGQGKSTQIPKLLLYATKMLDYKNNGTVICTQPRIGPTENNAKQISLQLGLPIEEYSHDFNQYIKTNNYYVQYKDQIDQHFQTQNNHPTLKIVTDGTLLVELIKNPLLKKQYYDIRENNYIYSYDNLYDIVIVDEAHEHNKNMDIILTLMRYTIFYNNSIKLIIMSATMEYDEPIFRNYYSIINDNLIYPIRTPQYNIMSTNIEEFNSNLLDRRFHISPPGETTQYKINEIYTPQYKNPIDIVKKILLESNFGDILLFELGEKEINKIVSQLNIILPSNVIALPYYSKLDPKYKYIIENINVEIKNLQISKNKVSEYWGYNYIESFDLPKNTYNRCIIVATNIAEASITIPSLKYVIDNGKSKVSIYDDKTGTTSLVIEDISESNRKQRKGRVGRVSDGTVYYLYEKNAKLNIKQKYNITNEELTEIIPQLLTNTYDDLELIPTKYIPVNNIKYYNNINDNNEVKDLYFYKMNIHDIFTKQYHCLTNKYNDLNVKIDNSLIKLINGYSYDTLVDTKGTFYIIHPLENHFERNILYKIIDQNIIITDNNTNYYSKNLNQSYDSFNSRLISNLFYIKCSSYYYKFLICNDGVNTIRSELADIILDFNKIINNVEDSITLLCSIGYKSFDIVLPLLYYMKNFTIKNNDTNIEYIIDLIKNFKQTFKHLLIFSISDITTVDASFLINRFKNDINIIIKKYLNSKLTLKYKDWTILNDLYNSGNINTNTGYYKMLNKISILQNQTIYEFKKYEEDIKKWCISYNIKYEIFSSFLVKYSSKLIDIITFNKDYNSMYKKISPIDFFKFYSTSFLKNLSDNQYEKYIKPFILAKPLNIAFRNNYMYYSQIEYDTYYINNMENNNDIIFYFDKILKDKNLEVSITNRIKITWLDAFFIYINNITQNKDYSYTKQKVIQELNNKLISFPFFDINLPNLNNYFRLLLKKIEKNNF